MGLIPDKGAVRSSRWHPPIQRSAIAFMRRPQVAQHGPDPSVVEGGVERCGEVRSIVAAYVAGAAGNDWPLSTTPPAQAQRPGGGPRHDVMKHHPQAWRSL
jgi:hypothetical protein